MTVCRPFLNTSFLFFCPFPFRAMSTVPLELPTRKNTIGKVRAASLMPYIMTPGSVIRQTFVDQIKPLFDNTSPSFAMPFSSKTRVGLWVGTTPQTKRFVEIAIDSTAETWAFPLTQVESLEEATPYGLALELFRRKLIAKIPSRNWGLFYVTYDNGMTWWNAREFKYLVAACFDRPIGKEDGRRRPLRVAA